MAETSAAGLAQDCGAVCLATVGCVGYHVHPPTGTCSIYGETLRNGTELAGAGVGVGAGVGWAPVKFYAAEGSGPPTQVTGSTEVTCYRRVDDAGVQTTRPPAPATATTNLGASTAAASGSPSLSSRSPPTSFDELTTPPATRTSTARAPHNTTLVVPLPGDVDLSNTTATADLRRQVGRVLCPLLAGKSVGKTRACVWLWCACAVACVSMCVCVSVCLCVMVVVVVVGGGVRWATRTREGHLRRCLIATIGGTSLPCALT